MAETERTNRDPLLHRPDPESLLRAAVGRRDAPAAARLVQQFVHRRGVNGLLRLQQTLGLAEGPEAAAWLERQWQDPSTAVSPPSAALPGEPLLLEPLGEVLLEPSPSRNPSPSTPPIASTAGAPPIASTGPIPSAYEPSSEPFCEPFSGPSRSDGAEPLEPAPAAALPEETFTEPLSESLRKLLSTPLEDPFGGPALTAEPVPAPVPEPTAPRSGRTAEPRGRRRTLSRIKGLMRSYVEDARNVLSRGSLQEYPEGEGESGPESTSAPDPFPSEGFQATDPDSSLAFPSLPASTGIPAAPAPNTLSDLRSWLPDGNGDLPKAS